MFIIWLKLATVVVSMRCLPYIYPIIVAIFRWCLPGAPKLAVPWVTVTPSSEEATCLDTTLPMLSATTAPCEIGLNVCHLFLVASSKTGARLYKALVSLCVCVCMYVCVCDSATAQTDKLILMKFSTNDLTDICEVCISRILAFPNDDVMAAIFALFRWGTLTVAIFVPFSSNLDIM